LGGVLVSVCALAGIVFGLRVGLVLCTTYLNFEKRWRGGGEGECSLPPSFPPGRVWGVIKMKSKSRWKECPEHEIETEYAASERKTG